MSNTNTGEYGGKGAALAQLKSAGFKVPHFIVLPVSFFKNLELNEENAAAGIIESCVAFLPEWNTTFNQKAIAVRSSAVAEDSAAHSFAGQFKTLLNVEPGKVSEAIAEVWLSAKSSAAYTTAHGLNQDTRMAVILQEMVEATAAGVAFSAHPVNGTEEIIINAVPGLGDKLVDGSVTGDTYAVLQNEIVLRQAASKEVVLSDTQILAVAAAAQKAQAFFYGPQDIEFAFCKEELYILQSRPITTLPKTVTIWDNSNIVESYPGLSQPLTFSFIEKMYEAVYRQFSELLGVSKKKIDTNANAFASMLGLLNGRVYYNLNSWYQALSLLPGYSINAAFMEKMMGVKEKPDIVIAQEESSKLSAWWEVANATASILKNLATARKQAKHFKKAFDKVYATFSNKNFDEENLQQLWQDYRAFEGLMVQEWKAPLVNDFFAMIYFGLLQKLCVSIAPEDINLHNRLLAGSEDVLTTQPMKELPKIARAIVNDAPLLLVAKEGSAEELYQALQQPEHAAAWKLFTEYIQVWGERSVAELKLETITYHQNPLLLVRLLQSYLQQQSTESFDGIESKKDRLAAEALAQQKLKGKWGKRLLFNHVLRNARYFVTQRENLRYYRTRGFGMVRRMMLGIGRQLATANIISEKRDVFWLKLDELETLTTIPKPMAEIVSQRQASYKRFEEHNVPQRIVSYGVPKGLINIKSRSVLQENTSGILQGIPCSAGIVRATIRLVTYLDELKSLNGAILATYATDPGFVVLFASASGILTERGSLLSHAAIVSREMGIPCIVGIEGLMDQLKDGTIVEMDGSTGTVTIVSK